MNDDNTPVVVYSTCPSLAVAEEIGGQLVESGLSACVNILPGMIAIYSWQGERQRDEEVVMIVKTQAILADRVVDRIVELHPYDEPAALVLPVSGGASSFLTWIGEQTSAAVTK